MTAPHRERARKLACSDSCHYEPDEYAKDVDIIAAALAEAEEMGRKKAIEQIDAFHAAVHIERHGHYDECTEANRALAGEEK